jgi:DNA-binding MarR family transcriptional regulator
MLVLGMMLENAVIDDRGHEVRHLAKALTDYVQSVLKTDLQLQPIENPVDLPLFLTQRFQLSRGICAGIEAVFAFDRGVETSPPVAVQKQLAQIERQLGKPVILVVSHMTSYQRSAHIGASQPFIVPGSHLFLPQMGMVLTERFARKPVRQSDKLTPAAQVVLFTLLLAGEGYETTPSQLADGLDYSAMSIGRALDELVGLEFLTSKRLGRERFVGLSRVTSDIWESAQPWLVSPVRSSYFVRWRGRPLDLPFGGLSALAQTTDLMDSSIPTYAMSGHRWSVLKEDDDIQRVAADYEADAQLDVWHYAPSTTRHDSRVNHLSLYAQFKDDRDERVALAAQSLIEGMWR